MPNIRPLIVIPDGSKYKLSQAKDGDTIPIELGGTGADNASDARTILNVPSSADLQLVINDLQAFIDRRDNPHQVTSTQTQSLPISSLGQPNGPAMLDGTGKVYPDQIPASIRPKVFQATSETEMLALSPNEGDECIRTDDDSQWIYTTIGWYQRPVPTVNNKPEDFHYMQKKDVITFTGTWWYTHLNMAMNNIKGGNYRVHLSFSYNVDSTNSDIEVRLVNNANQEVWEFFKCEVKDSGGYFESTGSSQRYQFSKTLVIPLEAFYDQLTLQFRSDTNRVEVSLWDVYLEVWKV